MTNEQQERLKDLQEELIKLWMSEGFATRLLTDTEIAGWWIEKIPLAHSLGKQEALDMVLKEIEGMTVFYVNENGHYFNHQKGDVINDTLSSLKAKVEELKVK